MLTPTHVLTQVEDSALSMKQVRAQWINDEKLRVLHDKVLSDEVNTTSLISSILRIGGCVCVLRVGGWVRVDLKEVHCARYSIHPGEDKLYLELKQHY